ncbi:MAG: VanZ family protein [Planctomycetota bacterium]
MSRYRPLDGVERLVSVPDWRYASAAEVLPDGSLLLMVDRWQRFAHALQEVDVQPGQSYRLSATLAAGAVGLDTSTSMRNGARLVVLPLADDGSAADCGKRVVARHDSPLPLASSCGGVVVVPDGCRRMCVGVELRGDDREVWLRAHSFSLQAVQAAPFSGAVWWLLLVLWSSALARCLPLALPRWRRDWRHVAVLGTLLAIFVGVLVPRQVPRAVLRWLRPAASQAVEGQPHPLLRSALSGPFDESLAAASTTPAAPLAATGSSRSRAPRSEAPTPFVVRNLFTIQKGCHVVLFFLLVVALLATRSLSAARVAVITIVMAAVSELLQMLTTTRTAALFDVGMDLLGGLLGAAFWLLVWRRRRRTRGIAGIAATGSVRGSGRAF